MRFEHEDDASAEALAKEDLVADLGVSFSVERLRRELFERYAVLRSSLASFNC
jgi:hypothetical protein